MKNFKNFEIYINFFKNFGGHMKNFKKFTVYIKNFKNFERII